MIGKRIGRLIVLAQCSPHGARHIKLLCRCDCGVETVVYRDNLANNSTKSCGCIRRENSKEMRTTHGGSFTPTYRIWANMKERCNNPKNKRYSDYGGRGVIVCESWNNSFADFFSDMGERPKGKQIDRVDNDGDYEPGNCKWSTLSEQARNTRRNPMFTHDGKTMCMVAWAELIGVKQSTIYSRLAYGWELGKALTTPARFHKLPIKLIAQAQG